MTTLDEQTRLALAGAPEADAVEFKGRWYSWGEIRKVADEVTRLLAEAGLTEPAAIAFAPTNRPVAVGAELGMVAGRHSIHMIYAFQSATGIARDIGRAPVSAVILAEADLSPEVLAVVKERGLAAIVLGDMTATAVPGAELAVAPQPSPAVSQILVHTSGTTGAPKHVGFSYETLERYIVGNNLLATTGTASSAPPPAVLFYPLGNISGIYSLLPPMLTRRRLVLMDRFTLDGLLDFIRRFEPAAPVVPPAGIRMLLDADLPKSPFPGVKMLLTGAAPLDPTVQLAFETKYDIPILLSYGATEFGGPVAAMTPELHRDFKSKNGSVGRSFLGAKLRVIDADTGAEVPAGTDGLLEVVSPRIGEHWIRTTDIAMLDADGFLYLRGRADGAIVRGGFKLLPEVIERALCLHAAVAAAIVVGIKDDRLGQVPAAAIQLKPGEAAPPLAELEQHLRQHVYATHIPTRWMFVDAVPLNTSAKPDLAGVRRMFETPAA